MTEVLPGLICAAVPHVERRQVQGLLLLAAKHRDFAVTEECGRYAECERYASAYPGRVLDVEYDRSGLAAACRNAGRPSVVLRDRAVSPVGAAGHHYATCPRP